ncbi:hypothetical protein cypCar_00009527 [Cyprinus carpio]|nr:hypothetical protein cypCar_00009527 [Cyprinus carpio]
MPAAASLLLLLAILWWPLVLPLAPSHLQSPPSFITLNGSRLNHLLLDTHSGHIYVGAVNVLYHLSPDLQLLSWGKTGPKLDSPDCLPPIDPTDCTQAETTDNTNKLLLLEENKGKDPLSLIVCGTVLQGICEKRSLENVSQVLYKTDNPVDTQYVAANNPRVSTVGVVVEQKGVLLMLVGRGYTSKGPGGIPPITMRRLNAVARHSAPAFSHEELGKLVVGSYSEYNNHFVKAFHHNSYVYFVFSRRDVWGKREYRTYVSRLCAGDPNFYSYVEVPLSCGGGYNLAQAAALGYHREQPTLFVAMGQVSTPTPTDRTALCVYKLEELDKALHGAQLLCYTQEGKDASNKEKAYIEYEVSSSCLKLPQDSLNEYPCGGEHTPSPIASAIALEATPAFTWTPPITAVTTATEVGHTIVLLGDKNGRLHKVFLHANGTGTKYDTVEVDAESPINADLLLDSTKQNVYVLTERKVTKLRVAQCDKHLDCHSCLSNRDPYCGWCSLEGRCTRKMDCARHAQLHHWIWSYGRERQCVSIESLYPSIQSREEQTQVSFTVLQLPVLSKDESLSCAFGSLAAQAAVVMENRITCQSPAPEQLPPSPPGNDHVSVPMALRFGDVTISHTNITFYDCKAVGRLNATSPCMACVSSMWPCHWCVKDELCTHAKSCPRQHIIYNSREQSLPHGPDSCPCVWALQSSPLVPVGFDSELSLQGKNLDIFEDEEDYACVLVIEGQELRLQATLDHDKETGTHVFKCATYQFRYSGKQFEYSAPVYLQWGTQRIDSAPHLRLQLYDCSVGQSDCSQCRAVAANYGCVWCADETPGCVYNQSCTTGTVDTCPPPLITEVEPLTGPLEGGILLTIQGSNLGQSFQDIQAGVTVAGVTCRPLPEAYRISTRGGRLIYVTGQNLNVVQQPKMSVSYEPRVRSEVRRRRYTHVSVRNPLVTGKGLTLAMSRDEVVAWLGDKECDVKTLDNTHLYCEPPEKLPLALDDSDLPRLKVLMGSLAFDLGPVQYDNDLHSPVPLAAQIGLAAGAAVVVLIVLVIILMYRRKSKQALRDYKKVLVQLETLEINVGDQCRKEFTDLMTEMMDLSSDVGGPGIPFLDYRTYAERVFFPGQKGAPLSQNLDLPDSRRQTVEQGLGQLNNLLNNRLFLIRFIHTLEVQQSFSQRDRGYVASLLTMALHDKLEYFTDVMKTLLGDLVQQYVAKNPKLMLRRTETVVEKMLTNWMSICLYSFLKTLTVLVKSGVEVQPCPVKVLDTDTITQVKDKILDQIYKGAAFSQRPAADSLDLEWRSGQAGHLTLSDDDVTAIVQGRWKRINTLQHYKVPDGATVALIPRSQSSLGVNQFYQTGEKTPMLEGEEEEGLRLWHLVKPSEDPEIPKHRKSSMRERERAKAIPEIYLTRLLSMKGTLQKFVDDVFVAILSTKRPPPIAVRFFFDFLDDMAEKHGIDDPETVHIWKTNSLPLRFWVNILKNPQFVFDVQVTDSVDAVLSVIAQTFIDSCTTSEHKVGRDSPVNKLLYAREIPRYKQLVERYYSDIHNAVSGCYQEMNSTLTELSGSFASEMNSLVALHELYKYINKYYDQIIMSLEEDAAGQKMQLAYRLQQVAALVENKVTDL